VLYFTSKEKPTYTWEHVLGLGIWYAATGSLPAIAESGALWGRRFWLILLAAAFVANSYVRLHEVWLQNDHPSAVTLAASVGLVAEFGLSFALDIFYIAATRWMLRRASDSERLLLILGIVAANVAVAGLIIGLSFALERGALAVAAAYPFERSALNAAIWTFWMTVGSVWALQAIDIMACSIFLVAMIMVLLHRLVWPVIERPLNSFKRYELVYNKKLLWAFAGFLILGPHTYAGLRAFLSKLLAGC